MIFLFVPALGSLVLIFAIALSEQFTFCSSAPMLDQVDAESATRSRAARVHKALGAKHVLTFQASRVLVVLIESYDYAAPRNLRAEAVDH
jgi:hypothetical protein